MSRPPPLEEPSSPPLEIEGVVVPPLHCPFPQELNPLGEAVQEDTFDWLVRRDVLGGDAGTLLDGVSATGHLVALVHPRASYEALRLASDWTALCFLASRLSGQGEDDPRRHAIAREQYVAALEGVALADRSPLLVAFLEIGARLRDAAPAAWTRRFVRHVDEWLASHVWEAQNRARRRVPDLATCVHMRPFSMGTYVALLLCEITDRYTLPLDVELLAPVQRLACHTASQIACANDVMAIGGELRRGEVHNIVLSIQQDERADLQAAILRAAAMHDALVRKFGVLAEEVLAMTTFEAAARRALEHHVAALRSWMGGHLHWGHRSRRLLMAK